MAKTPSISYITLTAILQMWQTPGIGQREESILSSDAKEMPHTLRNLPTALSIEVYSTNPAYNNIVGRIAMLETHNFE